MKYQIIFLLLCSSLFAQYPNDCVNYIQACGNKSINLDVSGIGSKQEVTGLGCTSGEHNSLWIRVTIETSGTLAFTLSPGTNDINEDYDFWIFGPDVDCNNIGYSIRCSTTNPRAARQSDNKTGLRDSETDTSEGPGQDGNSFVKSINAIAGENYFIVVDRPIGNSNFTLDWTGTAKLVNPLEHKTINNNLQDIILCDDDFNGKANFNLRSLDDKILKDRSGITITYHKNETNAISSLNPLPDNAELTTQTYYARVENTASGCYSIVNFKVILQGYEFKINDINVCPNENGDYFYKLADIQSTEFENSDSYLFYTALEDAKLGNANSLAPTQTIGFKEDKNLYVRVKKQGCFALGSVKVLARKPPLLKNLTHELCLDQNQLDINLNNYVDSEFANTVNFYLSKKDYIDGKPIRNPSNFRLNFGNSTLFVVAENDYCSTGLPLEFKVHENPSINFPLLWEFCEEELPAYLILPEKNNDLTYEWSMNNQTGTSPSVKEFGQYTLRIKDKHQCFRTYDFQVNKLPSLVIKDVRTKHDELEIIPAENGEFLYSIDKIHWQTSPIFKNLPNGNYSAYIKKQEGCVSVPFNSSIVLIFNFLTPNGDGRNDYIEFPSLADVNGNLKIFDRNGQILVEKDLKNTFRWYGKSNGKPLPQDDYWYIIKTDLTMYKGHITIKSH